MLVLLHSVQMCKIPQLGQRLDLLLSIRELPESIRDLEPVSAGALLECLGSWQLDERGPKHLSAGFKAVHFGRINFGFFSHLCV